jgi:hypothetical protein
MLLFRRLFICWWGGCPGTVERPPTEEMRRRCPVCFKCSICGRCSS